MTTTAMQRKRAAGTRTPKRQAQPRPDPSDDLDWQAMTDQDSDYVRDQYEGIGPIMWGLAVALIALLTYGVVGMFT